jgi:methionyl-tRNA formyltransferase
MPQTIILLTGSFDASDLSSFLAKRHPECALIWVQDLDVLIAAIDSVDCSRARLVSFCTGVIVPGALLHKFGCGAYNIHPGPPSFPGRHPESWGVYHAAPRFGATLHVMTPRVDEGAIVDTIWFDVAVGTGQRILAETAFKAALDLLLAWFPRLAGEDATLPPNGEAWHGRKWRRADLDAMTRFGGDIDAVEFERRRRAFAELPGCTLTLVLHGREFVYAVPADPS